MKMCVLFSMRLKANGTDYYPVYEILNNFKISNS